MNDLDESFEEQFPMSHLEFELGMHLYVLIDNLKNNDFWEDLATVKFNDSCVDILNEWLEKYKDVLREQGMLVIEHEDSGDGES